MNNNSEIEVNMLSVCAKCGCLLKEGEDVEAVVRSTYHILKSKISFALDKHDMHYVTGTLAHVECPTSGN